METDVETCEYSDGDGQWYGRLLVWTGSVDHSKQFIVPATELVKSETQKCFQFILSNSTLRVDLESQGIEDK